jgi:integrase
LSQSIKKTIERVNRDRAEQDPPLPPIAPFHVNQLRHNAATRLVEQFGWDVARLVLGHSSVATTRIYVLDNIDRAMAALGT